MKRQFAVLATASLLASAALVTAKPATAGSYVSYSFGFRKADVFSGIR